MRPDGDVVVPSAQAPPPLDMEEEPASVKVASMTAQQPKTGTSNGAAAAAQLQTLPQSRALSQQTEEVQHPRQDQAEAAEPPLPLQHSVSNGPDSTAAALPISTELEAVSAVADSSQTAAAAPQEAAAPPVNFKEAVCVDQTPDASADLSLSPDDNASVTAAAQEGTAATQHQETGTAQLLLPFPPPQSVLQFMNQAKADKPAFTCARARPWRKHLRNSHFSSDCSSSDDEGQIHGKQQAGRSVFTHDLQYPAWFNTTHLAQQPVPADSATSASSGAHVHSASSQVGAAAPGTAADQEMCIINACTPDQNDATAGSPVNAVSSTSRVAHTSTHAKALAQTKQPPDKKRKTYHADHRHTAKPTDQLMMPSSASGCDSGMLSTGNLIQQQQHLPPKAPLGSTLPLLHPPLQTAPLHTDHLQTAPQPNRPSAIISTPPAQASLTSLSALTTASVASLSASDAEPPWVASLMTQMMRQNSQSCGRLEVLVERMMQKQEALIEAIVTRDHT